MPQPCQAHHKPEVSCPTCFPDEELELAIARLQAVSPPSAPTRRKPQRLDAKREATPKKSSWRDAFGED